MSRPLVCDGGEILWATKGLMVMNVIQWYIYALRRYGDFSSRSRRREYWTFVLLNSLITIILYIPIIILALSGMDDRGSVAGILAFLCIAVLVIFSLGTIVPALAVSVRRMHDLDKSGWWVLVSLVPLVGPWVYLYLTLKDGTPDSNRYGASPKDGRQ